MPFVEKKSLLGKMREKFKQTEARIVNVYRRRDKANKAYLYSWHRQEVLFSQYRLRASFASACNSAKMIDLAKLNILDVGCGDGEWLRTLMAWGATPERLHGIDLLPDRISAAKKFSPMIDFKVSSGYSIHFSDAAMELVSAHTVFSSILDASARAALANEMNRVLAPGCCIMIYDFRISDPRNADTRGICKAEIKRIFPGFELNARSLTLAPPIGRRITPWSPFLAYIIESLCPFLRTHVLFFLRKK
jgi:ubiquinone/menaquinone biosynthesis C-methylase UbiE